MTVHVLIYLLGQLQNLNFLRAIFFFWTVSFSQTAFSSVDIPHCNLKSSQQHFQFQVQKPSSAVVYMEASLSNSFWTEVQKMNRFPVSVPSCWDPTPRQPSHRTQLQQCRWKVKNKEPSRVKCKKNETLAKNANRDNWYLGELLVLPNHWHTHRQPFLKAEEEESLWLYRPMQGPAPHRDSSISQYMVR